MERVMTVGVCSGRQIVASDIRADNGVVHMINAVVLPAAAQ